MPRRRHRPGAAGGTYVGMYRYGQVVRIICFTVPIHLLYHFY
jgi:hypothetical protein